PRRALDLLVILGDRQAAFFVGSAFLRRPENLRIDEHQWILRLVLLGEVHGNDALGTATWIAASPIPRASYMVSNMSSMSRRISASILPTGFETARNRLSGNLMMSRNAMRRDVSGSRNRVNVPRKLRKSIGRKRRVPFPFAPTDRIALERPAW